MICGDTTTSIRAGSSSPAGHRRTSSIASRPRSEYDALLRSFGLDPAARSCWSWAIRRRTRPTRAGSSSGSCPGGRRRARSLPASLQASPARQGVARSFRCGDREGRCLRAGPELHRSRAARGALQHGDAVVANAGTILLDAIVNDRPAVCVLYDEGAPRGRVVGREERRRQALRGARRVGCLLPGRVVRGGRGRSRSRAFELPASSRRHVGASSERSSAMSTDRRPSVSSTRSLQASSSTSAGPCASNVAGPPAARPRAVRIGAVRPAVCSPSRPSELRDRLGRLSARAGPRPRNVSARFLRAAARRVVLPQALLMRAPVTGVVSEALI